MSQFGFLIIFLYVFFENWEKGYLSTTLPQSKSTFMRNQLCNKFSLIQRPHDRSKGDLDNQSEALYEKIIENEQVKI
jgi:hypothetical protein